MDFKELGRKIKNHREACGLTQQELSEKVGTTYNYICYIENGKKKLSLETLYKIAEVLKVKVTELIE